MLANALVCATVPVTDLQRARRFYGATLGLNEDKRGLGVDGGMLYQAGEGTMLHIYERPSSAAEHTVATFLTTNLGEVMADLRSRGVSFVEYDTPDLKTEHGVFSDPSGFKAAWIKDPDDNILSLEQLPQP